MKHGDLDSRYHGIADMYVDYARVYSGIGADHAPASTAP
jgi:hypothetical protein